jgi:hypothetical protein
LGQSRHALISFDSSASDRARLWIVGLRPASKLDRIAHEDETNWPSDPDPETWYYQGAILAYCGKKQAALHVLEGAVEQNYCTYSALLSDPLLAELRKDGGFDKLLKAAAACQDRVRAVTK